MNASRQLVAVVMVVALTTFAWGVKKEDKPDAAKLIVGNWEVTKCDKGAPLGVGATVEFTKDGKVKAIIKKDDNDDVHEGTYKFEKGKLIVTMAANNENVVTIKKITESELSVKMDESEKEMEFKKKK